MTDDQRVESVDDNNLHFTPEGHSAVAEHLLPYAHAALLRAQQAEIERLTELADKYKWQVRDTCTRAEQAEAEVGRMKQAIQRQAAAVRTLHHNEATEINQLRKGRAEAHRAIKTLDSEREMNAILTAENEAMRAAMQEAVDFIDRNAPTLAKLHLTPFTQPEREAEEKC